MDNQNKFSAIVIRYAIDNAIMGKFIFLCAADIPNTLSYVQPQIYIANTYVDLVPLVLNHIQS